MTISPRTLAVAAGFAIVSTLAVAAIVVAANRPPLLITGSSQSSSTVGAGVLATGDAKVSRKPDLAMVSAGVQSQQSTAAGAQGDLASKAAKLIARIKALGVADKDISTGSYWIGPVFDQGGQTISGYRASEELTFKWHNVDTVGKTLDSIVRDGGATTISVGFGLADPKAAQADARALAIADARTKAQAMAAAAGVKLGPIVRIADSAIASRPPIGYAAAAGAVAPDTQVPVGQMDVQVSVEVDFALA